MIPDDVPSGGPAFLMPAVMGPPIVWLASDEAAEVHDERIVATEFDRWLRDRSARPADH
jgi:gluconate 5-dehydrogenase